MKKFSYLILMFVIAASLASLPVLGQTQKWIRQSEIQPRISAAGDQSENMFGDFQATWYFDGAQEYGTGQPEDGWIRSWIRNSGSRFGCRNWDDLESGETFSIKLGGAPYGKANRDLVQFAVPDENMVYIHKYYRYHPPAIIVDGLPIGSTFPRAGDHYAPDKVWGTADVMVESHFRNWLGLDMVQRVLVWVSKHHNQYVVYDWTIVNSGNIDLDEETERKNESLDSLYFMRQLEMTVMGENERKAEWYTWTGVSPDGTEPRDSVRCLISYPAIDWERGGGPNWYGDALGCFDWDRDYLDDASSGGEVTLFAPKTDADHRPIKPIGPGSGAANGKPENNPGTDDITQPRSHGRWGPDDLEFKNSSDDRPVEDWVTVYNSMIYGEKGDPVYDPLVEYMEGTYPNTYHPVPTDMRGYVRWNDQTAENNAVFWHAVGVASMGPFHLDYLVDTLRIAWADFGGRLDPQVAYEVGKAWKDSSITFITQSGDTLDINDISLMAPHLPNQADTIHIPPVYRHNPSRWQDDGYACDRANLIKDMWVYSTVDSVIRHAINAQWNFDHNYMAPVPPPPPSIEVKSLAEEISISWWYEEQTDIPSDLAGFRVYRSSGTRGAGPLITNDGVRGEWEMIYEAGSGESSFSDTTAVRGEDYYYYVAAFDNGTHPETPYPGDVTGSPESLESGRWQNHTFGVVGAASLKRPGTSDLSRVRVVPNPYNTASPNMMYEGTSDKINFFNLTGNCTIRIYTLTGDLVTTIEHDDGSGDETWDNPTGQLYQVTDEEQHVVSGLYIANIHDNETNESVNVKFVIIR